MTQKILCCFLVLFILLSGRAFAQSDPEAGDNISKPGFRKYDMSVYADCDSPVVIDVQPQQVYGNTVPPNGAGRKQEIGSGNKSSNVAFEQEHNTAWYLLNISHSGELMFDIIPRDSTNDYDFLLFAYKGSDFCGQLQQKKLTPLRSNIRRNDIGNKGVTGLAADAPNELQGQGPGAQFSKSLLVKKGEQYMLVLDNVYPGGKGHKIRFYYRRNIELNGVVRDESGYPIAGANISMTAPVGELIFQGRSDDSGKYKTYAAVNEHTDYNLIVSDKEHLFDEKVVNTKQCTADGRISLKHVLLGIKTGQRFALKGLHFYGGLPNPLPQAYAAMRELLQLMKQNPSLSIRIEGHVTHPLSSVLADDGHLQTLSENRAEVVYDYLVQNGIERSRMEKLGLSNRSMLYREPKNEAQHAANRRVEIKVLAR